MQSPHDTLFHLVMRHPAHAAALALDRRDRILAAPVDLLDRWTDRLLDAASCDDVFVQG